MFVPAPELLCLDGSVNCLNRENFRVDDCEERHEKLKRPDTSASDRNRVAAGRAQRSRLTVILAGPADPSLVSILILLSAVLQSLSGIMSASLVAFAFVMLMPVIPILLRYTGSVSIAGNWLTGSYFASVTVFNLASHGTATGAVLSLILVAPLGFLVPGVVWPSIWATLVGVQISLTPMMGQLPFEQLITTDPEMARQAVYQLPVLITVFTLAGGLLANRIVLHGERRK